MLDKQPEWETRVGEDSLEDLEQMASATKDQLAATGDFRRGSTARTIAAAASPIVCARKRVTPGMGRDIRTRTVAGRGTKGRQLSVEEVDKVRAELSRNPSPFRAGQ
ncbi:hypothetical protein ABLN97_03440 [Mycobacterium tuberculosis]